MMTCAEILLEVKADSSLLLDSDKTFVGRQFTASRSGQSNSHDLYKKIERAAKVKLSLDSMVI